MKDGWEEQNLGELATVVKDIVQPQASSNVPYIGLEHISQGTFDLVGLGKESDVTSTKHCFRAGQILYGKLRPYFQKVFRPSFSGVCSTDIWVLDTKDPKVLDQGYLYAIARADWFTAATTASSKGTRMPRADWDVISNLKILLPPLATQSRIAEILGALDDKIECNRRINQTLEQMAQALYKHWFVDFGPFRGSEFLDSELGRIPKGWKVVSLGELVSINPKAVNPQDYPDEEFLHFSIPAFDKGCTPTVERGEQILSGKTLVDSDRVLVSKLNPRIYRVWTVFAPNGQRALSSTEFINYIPKRSEAWAFVNCYVRHERFINEFRSHATGTTGSRQRVPPQRTLVFLCVLPPTDALGKFEDTCGPYFKQIDINLKENQTLAHTRDYLLPKLLSGEIEVKAAEELTNDVL